MSFRALFLFLALVVAAPAQAQTPPPTCTMVVTPSTINKGASVTLKWTSMNATSANIPGPGLGNVAVNGQKNLIPVGSTRWVGTFTGPGGKATCSATVVVLRDGTPMTVFLVEEYDAGGAGALYLGAPAGASGPGTVGGLGVVPDPDGVEAPEDVEQPGRVDAPERLQSSGVANPAPTLPRGSDIQLNQSEGTGIVPCTGLNCEACHVAQLAQNIINFLIGLSIPLAAAMFAWAGILYFSSSVVNKLEKARKIFTSVLIGFAITVGAWLIVQTILSTVLRDSYKDWNTIQCVGQQNRPMNATVQDLLNTVNILNQLDTSSQGRLTGAPLVSPTGGAPILNVTCHDGSTYDQASGLCQACYDNGAGGQECEVTAPKAINTPSSVGRGDCSTGALQDIWGSNAAAMSCIAQGESSCNPNLGSGVDKTLDRQSFSYGLYQVNMSVHNVSCSNFNGGATVNCPSAFSGRNFNSQVVNQQLYEQCRAMLQNTQCNTEMAQKIFAKQGFDAWRNTARNCGL